MQIHPIFIFRSWNQHHHEHSSTRLQNSKTKKNTRSKKSSITVEKDHKQSTLWSGKALATTQPPDRPAATRTESRGPISGSRPHCCLIIFVHAPINHIARTKFQT